MADLDALKQAVSDSPKDAQLRCEYGTALAEAGELKAAAEQLEEAANLDPELTVAHYNIGVLFGRFLLEDLALDEMWEDHTDEEAFFEKASSAYKEALRLDPKMTAAMNNLARLQAAMGLKDEAKEYFQRSLEVDPSQSDVLEDLEEVDED